MLPSTYRIWQLLTGPLFDAALGSCNPPIYFFCLQHFGSDHHFVISSWEVFSHVISLQPSGPASKVSLVNKMPEDDCSVLPFPDQQQTLRIFKPKHSPHKGRSRTHTKCLRELIKPGLPEFYLCWTIWVAFISRCSIIHTYITCR